MIDNLNKIPFNFSYSALNLLGKQMYTNKWSAISELVANGLDAGAETIRIYINSTQKESSVIEIFDDGSGMSYEDLRDKYTLIGRNKRESDSLISDKVKGRKGIGKLAALYLSKKYYIVTKHEGTESAWLLDSSGAADSDIPTLTAISISDIEIDNKEIWSTYKKGTLIKLANVDMKGFAEKKLDALQKRIADYYLLDKLEAEIKVAYVTQDNNQVEYKPVRKEVAFKNFYAFFENNDSKRNELAEAVYLAPQRVNRVDVLLQKREVVILTLQEIPKAKINGIAKILNSEGVLIEVPYELKGWIGIHATIAELAKENDQRFTKNQVYSPNRLKLYIRDKLAVENLLDSRYISNNQAGANYIEGEITFDVLDDDRLPDISTTSREGLTTSDERVQLLIEIVTPIINRLIIERQKISDIMREEQAAIEKKEEEAMRALKKAEEEALRTAEKEAEAAEISLILALEAEEEKEKAKRAEFEQRQAREQAEKEVESLKNQNQLKDILLNESDPKKEKLLTHELNIISRKIDGTTRRIIKGFSHVEDFDQMYPHLLSLKECSDRLTTIKRQFLKLNTHDIIGPRSIDLKNYLKNYFSNISPENVDLSISENPFVVKEVDFFDLGVIFDNLITNAAERNAEYVKVTFLDDEKNIVIESNTGPIDVWPESDIFKLGVSSKKNGSGIGLFLVRKICEKFGWSINLVTDENLVKFIIDLEGLQ
ncbi:MAG: ATP-binding protein [Turicibacter sp.]|nr:ATP-binding protein [Turicibacter sp.]